MEKTVGCVIRTMVPHGAPCDYELPFIKPNMKSPNNHITLQLSPETIQAQCLFAIQQSRNTSHALAALIALQTFVGATAQPDDRESPAHRAIREIITAQAAILRDRLLAEHAHALSDAMRAQDCAEITRIYDELSRNGFWQVAQIASDKLDAMEQAAAKIWLFAWCTDAKDRALAASGYPDALNFQKAGISPKEYVAMTDLNNYMKNIQ